MTPPQKPDPHRPASEQRTDRSGLVAIVVIIAMGLLLIMGFGFLADWLGRLFTL